MVVSVCSPTFQGFPLLRVVIVGFNSFTLVHLWFVPSLAGICQFDYGAAGLICLDDSGGIGWPELLESCISASMRLM